MKLKYIFECFQSVECPSVGHIVHVNLYHYELINVFSQRHRKLYIFGGQRNKEHATDFIAFDVDTQNISVVSSDGMKPDKNNVPQSGFTQRATIDCERDEIYVLSVSVAIEY